MTNVLVTNVFGPLNRGDHELLSALFDRMPLVDASGLARDPELCEQHFPAVEWVEQPGKRLHDFGPIPAPLLRFIFLVAFLAASKWPMFGFAMPASQRVAVGKLRKADLVVACPGGYLHDDSFSFYLQVAQPLAARLAGRPLVLAPMSIGPLRSKISRKLTALALGSAEVIYVRDEESLSLCHELGLDAQLNIDLAVSDMADSVPAYLSTSEDKEPYVVATLIRFAFPEAHDRSGAKELYEDRCVEVLSRVRASGYGIRLMVQVDGDLEVIERVASRLGGDTQIMRPSNPAECRALIAGSSGVLASRLHSGIFALQVGAPVLFLGYQPKSVGVLRMLGLTDLVRPLEDFDGVEVAEALVRLMKDRQGFGHRVRKAIDHLPPALLTFSDEIRSRVS